ncbi:LamG-like jellyroll fold domain-containing protein [Caulobacter sp. NIBR2454]|uniref:LamG-like jellyroll fold domain-containing protein n=1 Tax=Caulobacter sp. NIBR2454 TaxID=3015996 RepID=UPI0022B67F7E|nr:LamG-like jellyroll fold domain-containing protein [Caulobacter sp. NIBR2454]
MTQFPMTWWRTLAFCAVLAPAAAGAQDGLLFRASGDAGFVADRALGDPIPNFQEKMSLSPAGRSGSAMARADDGAVAWNAPGNIYGQRGTVAFFWRAGQPLTTAPFVIFRASFAAHTSFDMTFARIDWSGEGIEAFITDANLARTKVAFKAPALPSADAWTHIALGWDETHGVRLFINGVEAARTTQSLDLDTGLDQFGFAGRMISPHQVHSRYNFSRGSDVDEVRVYDHLLSEDDAKALADLREPAALMAGQAAGERQAWLHRFGWDRATPPLLTAPSTRVRKVEFSDAKDLKAWMWKGVDGVPETTWPGVYNRSRLPGRDERIVLPDWNVYVDGGKAYDLTVPAGESFNQLEIRGAAHGALTWTDPSGVTRPLLRRSAGAVRTVDQFARLTGGRLRFANDAQETPIQEVWAYDVAPGRAPEDRPLLRYVVRSQEAPSSDALSALQRHIQARFPADERATVVALPTQAAKGPLRAKQSGAASAPLAHILIPSRFDASPAAQPVTRSWNYGWQNMHSGLDGVVVDIPALNIKPDKNGLAALNIRIKDPIWPGRDLIDLSVSVRPGEARSLWLDLRDRILTDDSLWLTIASSAPDFSADSIDGLGISLVFKDRQIAKVEHVADRFNQVKDNWAFLVEARPATVRADLYRRLYTDISDLLRVDPDHEQGRLYWQEIGYATQDWPPFEQPKPRGSTPLWAFRQLEDLKLVGRFVDWWIDERQVAYGDFGGGISDDTDLMSQWPGLALMGYKPDKIRTSLNALADAVYKNGMMSGGLGVVATDELHAYEEGLNSDAAALYLNWGDPLRLERLMATTKALQSIVTPNAQGHLHFNSNWYGAAHAYREPPWDWQKLYSFTVMHAPILMGIYNANPLARGLVTGAMDGVLAHGKQDDAGVWSFPNEISWSTDAARVGDTGGMPAYMQSAWASWRWTGEDRYLRPILGRAAKAGAGSIADLNENLIDALGRRGDWGAALTAQAPRGDPFAQYAAWLTTGDKRWLETLHAKAIQDKSQRMYMLTEGHWWTDRVEQPSEILQRERLGGVALKRNWTYPGHAVSWRFDQTDGAQNVALLVTAQAPDRFKITAHNISDRSQAARMTAWAIAPGRYRLKAALDTDGDDRPDGPVRQTEVVLERSASTDLVFEPGVTTLLDFELVEPAPPAESRADLGVGAGDVRRVAGGIEVTVHSLGAVQAKGGVIRLHDASGTLLVQAAIPTLDAPVDLAPKTWSVKLKVGPKADLAGAQIKLSLGQGEPETTLMNNQVILP